MQNSTDARAGGAVPAPTKGIWLPPGLFRFSTVQLLGALLLLLITAPFVQPLPGGDLVETALVTLVLLSAAMAVGGQHRALIAAVVLAVPPAVGRWAEHYWTNLLPQGLVAAAAMPAIGFTILMLFRFIFRARRVSGEVLCAAIANYLLLGFLWGFAYACVDKLVPGSFAFSGPAPAGGMVHYTPFYFSFVTLCTVGYGDIAPVSSPARMLAILEAMTGTFYIAMLIARLVSLHATAGASQDRREEARSGR